MNYEKRDLEMSEMTMNTIMLVCSRSGDTCFSFILNRSLIRQDKYRFERPNYR